MDYTVTTIGGGESLVTTFNGMVALFGSGSYMSMLKLAATFGLVWILLEVSFGGEFKRGFKWLFGMFLAFNVMLVPKVTVIVEDKLNPQIKANIINNVPFIVGVIGHLTSIIEDKATELAETAYSSGGMEYHKYGMLGPVNVVDGITRAN